jgi:hypothetical protein
MPLGIMDLRTNKPANIMASSKGRPMEAAMDRPEAAEGHSAHTPYFSKNLLHPAAAPQRAIHAKTQ